MKVVFKKKKTNKNLLNEVIKKLSSPQRNYKGELCYYAIYSHRTGKLLGRYKTRKDAERALKRMERFRKIKEDIQFKEIETYIIKNDLLNEEEKQKLLDIFKVKKNMIKNASVLGIPANFYEENFIKRYYPAFYKLKVKRRKRKYDKKGLPINPYVYFPKSI